MVIPEYLQELLEIGADRVKPTLTAEIVLQLRPTYSQVATGWVGEHGILVPDSPDARLPSRLLRIGVLGTGWAKTGPAVTQSNMVAQFKEAYGSEPFPADAVGMASWALEANDCVFYPITGWDLLPPHMTLSAYDVGHRVIVTRGEVMGAPGVVVSGWNIQREQVEVELTVGGVLTRTWCNPAAIAVIMDDDPAKLAPLAVLYPPGTIVWVQHRIRGGQPMGWRKAVALQVQNGMLDVMLPDAPDQPTFLAPRDQVAPGDGPEPPPGPIALTAKGTRPAPRLRKPKTNRWTGIPPAKK